MVISDAYVLSEMDDVSMAASLAGLQRVSTDTTKVTEQLRSVCLSMLCAAMQWDEFRSATFGPLSIDSAQIPIRHAVNLMEAISKSCMLPQCTVLAFPYDDCRRSSTK